MLNSRLFRVLARLCLGLWGGTALAQGSGTLNTNRPELMMSIGTVAHLLDLTPDVTGAIRGVPTSSFEVRKGEIVPIDPHKLVLVFPGSAVPYGSPRENRRVVLTEDGVWAVAPLNDDRGGSYFLSEAQLKKMIAPNADRSWGLVRSPIQIAAEGVRFDRGEIVLLEAPSPGIVVVLVERDNDLTAAKYRQIVATRSSQDQGSVPEAFRFSLGPSDRGSIGEIVTARAGEFAGTDAQDRMFSVSERFKKWNKTFRLDKSSRIDCNQQRTRTDKTGTEMAGTATAKVSAASDTLLKGLKSLGISFSADAESKFTTSWSSQEETVTTTKDSSFALEQFLFSFGTQSQGISVASARECLADKTAYFFVVTPSSSGRAVDKETMMALAARISGLTWKASGHLSTACYGTYLRVVDYFTDELAFDDRLARLVASRILRVSQIGDLNQFYGC